MTKKAIKQFSVSYSCYFELPIEIFIAPEKRKLFLTHGLVSDHQSRHFAILPQADSRVMGILLILYML